MENEEVEKTEVEPDNETEEAETSSVKSSSSESESVFEPPADLPGENQYGREGYSLPLAIFTKTETTGATTIKADDELLENALGHLDESLSPVLHLQNAETKDFTILIPFETAYR